MDFKVQNNRLITGLVIGKFMPPHVGHQYLVNFASEYVQDLYVIISTDQDDIIPGAFRKSWMEHLFPRARILTLDKNHNHQWLEDMRHILPTHIDFVFASEDYGQILAEGLNAKYIPIDINRQLFPVSSSSIRQSPLQYWDYLPDCVKPYFLKKVCLFGASGSGKTKLAQQLANHFNSLHVAEYARKHFSSYDEISQHDFVNIARAQHAAEVSTAGFANRILFCDTNILLLKILCQKIHGSVPDELLQICDQSHYDLTLVPNIIDANASNLSFMRACIMELEQYGIKYHALNGSEPKRFSKALRIIRANFPKLDEAGHEDQNFVLLGNR